MQKDYSVFIGLDVSKDKPDYSITTKSDTQNQFGVLGNDAKSINAFLKKISKGNGIGCKTNIDFFERR